MRVDDEVGLDAALGERHVDRGPQLRAHTLLTVARRELITDDGLTGHAVLDADRLAGLDTGFGAHDADAVDVALLGVLVLDEVGDAVDVDVGVSGGVVAHGVPGGDETALAHAGANVRKTVFVQGVTPFGLDLAARGETEELCDLTARAAPPGILVVQGVNLRLVNRTVSESTLVRGLVNNHSVVHVVTRVGDNRHHGIGAVGEVVQSVGVVQRWPHNRRLTRLQSVELVVCAVVDGRARRSHRLFAHLALVHVTRRLVIVGERRHVGNNGKDVGRGELNVC